MRRKDFRHFVHFIPFYTEFFCAKTSVLDKIQLLKTLHFKHFCQRIENFSSNFSTKLFLLIYSFFLQNFLQSALETSQNHDFLNSFWLNLLGAENERPRIHHQLIGNKCFKLKNLSTIRFFL